MNNSLRQLPLVRDFRRWYVHRRTQVFMISMPKAGRTWLRVMVGRVIQNHARAPLEAVIQTARLHRLAPGVPRLLSTHDGYKKGLEPAAVQLDKSRYRSKRVILLVRDPRDVLVSLYFQDRYRREESVGLELSDLVHTERDGLKTIIAFYNSWAAGANVPRDLLVVRYESLKLDAVGELRRIFAFLEVPWVTDDLLEEAVAFASMQNMRELERANALNSIALRPTDASNPDSFKVRRGKVGGYVDYLSPTDVEEMNRLIATHLHPFYSWYRP
jgi:hypothetical protein